MLIVSASRCLVLLSLCQCARSPKLPLKYAVYLMKNKTDSQRNVLSREQTGSEEDPPISVSPRICQHKYILGNAKVTLIPNLLMEKLGDLLKHVCVCGLVFVCSCRGPAVTRSQAFLFDDLVSSGL